MNTTYKILKKTDRNTYIAEFWDDILIFRYTVYAYYSGGNIVEFLRENPCYRYPDFDGLDEFYRRTNILDF